MPCASSPPGRATGHGCFGHQAAVPAAASRSAARLSSTAVSMYRPVCERSGIATSNASTGILRETTFPCACTCRPKSSLVDGDLPAAMLSSRREAPGLLTNWMVLPNMSSTTGKVSRSGKPETVPYPINERHPAIVERLALLEAQSIDRFPGNWTSLADDARRAIQELAWLGVGVGNSGPCEQGETATVEYIRTYGGVGRAELLLKALKPEYLDSGNIAKLTGGAERRHLFIGVDHSAGDAYVALHHGELPDELLELPREITNVWVWADDYRVFEYTRETGWTEHPVSAGVLISPQTLEAGDCHR